MLFQRGYPHTQANRGFLSRNCIVVHIAFRSVIHFEFIFVKCGRSMSRSFLYTWMSSFAALFVEKIVLAPLYCLWSFIKNQLTIFMWVQIWALYSVPLIYLPIFSLTPHHFDYFIVSLKVQQCQASDSSASSHPFKVPCDYIRPILIIQGNPPISRSSDYQH